MKITKLPQMDILEFEKINNLELVVGEREPIDVVNENMSATQKERIAAALRGLLDSINDVAVVTDKILCELIGVKK